MKIIIKEVLKNFKKGFSKIAVFFMIKNNDGVWVESSYNNGDRSEGDKKRKEAYREAVKEAGKWSKIQPRYVAEEIFIRWSRRVRSYRGGFLLENTRDNFDLIVLIEEAEEEWTEIITEEDAEGFAVGYKYELLREMVGSQCRNDLCAAVNKIMKDTKHEFGEEKEEEDETEEDLMQIIIEVVQ